MSRDDEVAIVKFKNMYYVSWVQGGNWILAVLKGRKFSTLQQAQVYARQFKYTEHGIRIRDTLDTDVYKVLAEDTRWENEMDVNLKREVADYKAIQQANAPPLFSDSDFPELK